MINLLLTVLKSLNSSPKQSMMVGSGGWQWPSWYNCSAARK